MTGLETGLVMGGKFLAPHAAKAALKLAKKATYRWRVDRDVGRRLNLQYPRRHFRSWLKTIKADDLHQPVELGGPDLAVRLSKWLCERDPAWERNQERLTDARRLVEATYLAILKLADPGLERQLREQWSRGRNEDLIERLVIIAGGSAPVSPEDLSVWLWRRSAERRRLRLAAFDVDADLVDAQLSGLRELVPDIHPGSFRVLVGSFGAGKSEIAEEWHRTAISQNSEISNSAVPVWVSARDVATSGLESSLAQLVGAHRVHSRGTAVVVDGLDEVDSGTAEAIARDARILVASNPRCTVLATCRPSVLLESADDIAVDGFSEDAATTFVEALAGGKYSTLNWSDDLIDTIRRPFFALAAGSLIAAGHSPANQVELIDKLAQNALMRPSNSSATSSRDLFSILISLGVSLTQSNGHLDGLSFQERQAALSTRLVSRNASNHASFVLPIFEQWFAAQALIDEGDLFAEAISGSEHFDKWRWAVAIATLGGTSEQVDNMIEACLRSNPGAGAWIIEQVSPRKSTSPPKAEESIDRDTARSRLLRTHRTWIDSLGPISTTIFPIDDPSNPIRLGARVTGRFLHIGWSTTAPTADECLPLPDHIQLFSPRDENWQLRSGGAVPEGIQWPWTKVRDHIASSTLKALNVPAVFGPEGGVWHREIRYRTARLLMSERSMRHSPLDCQKVIEAGQQLLSQIHPGVQHATIKFGPHAVELADIKDLVTWLQTEGRESLERLVPKPDVLQPASGRVWDLYTPRHMARFCAEMYGLACVAYEEVADTDFAAFAWSLGHRVIRPFGIIGSLKYHESEMGTIPSFSYEMVPQELLEEITNKEENLVVSSNGRSAVKLLSRSSRDILNWHETAAQHAKKTSEWVLKNGTKTPFQNIYSAGTAIECSHERPVSYATAQWIWQDLRLLSLAQGTFPQLDQ
ncbi:hypothetical protein [Amycolatopsis saalfeldensis]|uniref:NACHT domain-containing protein n=1 Tax=Amycolatopsis saalfeldensis TaxID=394193 RepID=A0A1H8YGM2_9PSEU|nr:hypothetical protein [Amycolatopsis saalfeldensis]SEP51266.1 hypothetical protein SAMN04489732_115217 [Amycolatopsis saalfeldensis]